MPTISCTGRQSLDAFIDEMSRDPSIPPFVFAVTSAEGIIYAKSKGLKNPEDSVQGEVDVDTVFKLCSQSKLITHIAALQLVESGQLSPETPVSVYIPAFKNLIVISAPPRMTQLTVDGTTNDASTGADQTRPAFKPAEVVMTVGHLMSYTSGLAYPFTGIPDWSQHIEDAYNAPHDPADPIGGFLRYIQGDFPGIPIMFEPGTDWAYGYSSDILGFIVEKVSGMNLEQYLQRSIFGPLRMTHSSFYETDEMKEKLMTILYRRPDGSIVPWGHSFYECAPERVHAFYGGAAIMCSGRDYLTLLRHLLQILGNKAGVEAAILRKESVAKLFMGSLPLQGKKTIEAFIGSRLPVATIEWSNGQAVTLADWPGMRKDGSGFWSGYLNTTHWIDPKTGIAGVLQSQLLPPLDGGLLNLAAEVEGFLYSVLE